MALHLSYNPLDAFVGGREHNLCRVKKKGASNRSLQVGQNDLDLFPTPHGALDDNKHQIPQIHWPSQNHDPPNASLKEGTTEILFMAVVNLHLTLY